jgi:predicted Zn-ribbon and HTH transcriptional regulator
MTRLYEILDAIKSSLSKTKKAIASYQYQCRKCGLILETNRNQPNLKCPNDGSTMYRI